MKPAINLRFPTPRPVPAEVQAVAARPPLRSMPRRRPHGLRVALLAAWAVLCGVA